VAAKPLRDILGPDLVVLFVGINPGLRSAALGHHFAGYSNRFWRLLYESRLVSEPIGWQQDDRILESGFGMTNLISRPTAGIAGLRAREYQRGRRTLARKIRRHGPRVVALVGVTIYREIFPARKLFKLGLQPERLAGASLFVLPSPSGRNATRTWRQMLAAYRSLRRYLDAGARG
jgi:TDG/mug DNA glycosylase family protein